MSLLLRSIRTAGCGRKNNDMLCLVSQVRNGGGGGRPGGLPVFNWKEKKILRISNKLEKKVTKIKESGDYADIEHLFDASKGDISIDWDLNQSYVSEAVPDTTVAECSSRKQVSMAMLFGPSKSFGFLPRKENVEKLRFSHSRVFGVPRKSQYNPKGNSKLEDTVVA